MSQQTTVLAADNHPVFLKGLVSLLKDANFNVVAAFCNSELLLDTIRELKPRVTLLSVNMPGTSALEIAKMVSAEKIPSFIVLLTDTAPCNEFVSAAMDARARGVIAKNATSDEFIWALRAIARGESWLLRDLRQSLIEGSEKGFLAGVLTNRETEVALLATTGLSNKEIGRKLVLSEGTVKVHLHHVFSKLQVKNRTGLAAALGPVSGSISTKGEPVSAFAAPEFEAAPPPL
ncbi:MAG: response regulator transcription factor [Beijerinckiaceae bacterium]|nr:response regulator transcription factor [Beijerinckiaceae bacterium]